MHKRFWFSFFCMCMMVSMIGACGGPTKSADKLVMEGQYDKAIEMMEKYVKENPEDHIAFMVLGDAYIGKARSIGGYGYNPATLDIVIKGSNYYKKSYEIKRTRLVEDKMALASQMMEAP